ncbi:hypothetical protein TCAL_15124 [Tigriopus californicus]|uniref:Uncharacterized protein n=1 Tax=Tigriopus californicus TaxID=6832 RepID=A0A553NTS1_TIGCA|nr:hypothetical protein TCAL_15124 [Tigriopus californicus]
MSWHWAEEPVADQNEKKIQLNSAVDIDDLVLASTHLLTLKNAVLDHRLNIDHSSQEVEISDIQMLGPARQNIRIHLTNEIRPSVQELGLCFARDHNAPHDFTTGVKCKYIPNERLRISLRNRGVAYQQKRSSGSALHLLNLLFPSRILYLPAGNSIQLHPTTLVSAMKRISKSMLASNALKGELRLKLWNLTSLRSRSRLAAAIIRGTAIVIFKNWLILLP